MDLEEKEPHLLAAAIASMIGLEILDCLPSCDLIGEMQQILFIQHDILTHLQAQKHFGSERLDNFLSMLSELQYETRKLKNANK